MALGVVYKTCVPLEAEHLHNYICDLPTSLIDLLSEFAEHDFMNCDIFNLYKLELCELLEEKVRHRKFSLDKNQQTLYNRALCCIVNHCSYIKSQNTEALLSKLPRKVIYDTCTLFRGYWWAEVTSKYKTSKRFRFYCFKKGLKKCRN